LKTKFSTTQADKISVKMYFSPIACIYINTPDVKIIIFTSAWLLTRTTNHSLTIIKNKINHKDVRFLFLSFLYVRLYQFLLSFVQLEYLYTLYLLKLKSDPKIFVFLTAVIVWLEETNKWFTYQSWEYFIYSFPDFLRFFSILVFQYLVKI